MRFSDSPDASENRAACINPAGHVVKQGKICYTIQYGFLCLQPHAAHNPEATQEVLPDGEERQSSESDGA